jgi:hypothetical protein
MAHFAEIDLNNKVLRIVAACDQDIANNGGKQSEQAAEYFKTVCPLSENGIKWVQTSQTGEFRKKYAGIDHTYDANKDKFIEPQPFASWSLNSNDDWQSPVAYPSITTYGDNITFSISWNEVEQKWIGKDKENNEFTWVPSSSSWLATGQ